MQTRAALRVDGHLQLFSSTAQRSCWLSISRTYNPTHFLHDLPTIVTRRRYGDRTHEAAVHRGSRTKKRAITHDLTGRERSRIVDRALLSSYKMNMFCRN